MLVRRWRCLLTFQFAFLSRQIRNPTYATVVGKLVLGPPHEGPLSIRIRGDAAFVLNGNIVPR